MHAGADFSRHIYGSTTGLLSGRGQMYSTGSAKRPTSDAMRPEWSSIASDCIRGSVSLKITLLRLSRVSESPQQYRHRMPV
jgi:hypothetical protein